MSKHLFASKVLPSRVSTRGSRYKELLISMTWREFQMRYRGSFGGVLWSVVQPLFMIVVYTVVFSMLLKVRFGGSESPFAFAVYAMCGVLPFQALSEGLSKSATVITDNVNLVKRVVFPLEILPLSLTMNALLHQMIGLCMLLPFACLLTGHVYWTFILLPLIVFLQLCFSAGLNWLLAGLAVYVPDLSQVVSMVLPVWMFLTPILYPEDLVPVKYSIFLRVNPLAGLVHCYRAIIMRGEVPELSILLWTSVPCLAVFFFGNYLFIKIKKGFSDVI